jgi:hypothetical protein
VVVSIACDVVARTGNPLSRQSTTDLAKRAAEELNKPISRTTVWEILDGDAVKPWQYEHWLFPRAPDFFALSVTHKLLKWVSGFSAVSSVSLSPDGVAQSCGPCENARCLSKLRPIYPV